MHAPCVDVWLVVNRCQLMRLDQLAPFCVLHDTMYILMYYVCVCRACLLGYHLELRFKRPGLLHPVQRTRVSLLLWCCPALANDTFPLCYLKGFVRNARR